MVSRVMTAAERREQIRASAERVAERVAEKKKELARAKAPKSKKPERTREREHRVDLQMVDPDDFVLIGLDTAHKSRAEHVLWDARVHDIPEQQTIETYKEGGVIQNVNARRVDGKLEVIAGRSRVIGSRMANEQLRKEGRRTILVPCRVIVQADEWKLFRMATVENEHRRETKTMDRARSYSDWLALGRSKAEAAIIFKVTKQTLDQWERMMKCCAEVIAAVDEGKIAASAAVALYGDEAKPNTMAKQKSLLAEILANGGGSTVKIRQIVQKEKTGKATTIAPGKRVAKKVFEWFDEHQDTLEEMFILGAKWHAGEIPSSAIKGLDDVLKQAMAKRAPAEEDEAAA